MTWIAAVGAIPIYVCHVIGWFTGLFAPAKSESRGTVVTALAMFFSPILMYIVYFILCAIFQPRPEVRQRLLDMFNGFALILWLLAYYCSLIQIGCIAGYMGLTIEKFKPQALAWFIVGGCLLFTVCMAIIPWVPWWALYIVCVFTFNVYYFVISSLRELIGVVDRIRTAIHEHIHEG
jgi:hypothetical protein